jgi:transmembrane 9 superfamily member 2/4
MLQENSTCHTLCTIDDITPDDAKFINERIKEDYALNWLIDGLPAAEAKEDLRSKEVFFDMGFNLGVDDEPYHEQPILNNHYDIVLKCVFACKCCNLAMTQPIQISHSEPRKI